MNRYYYLIEFQYLGFRYHGWQKQPNVNTVQRMVDRTLHYILDGDEFKTLISGRTDAMVSANQSYFELFLKERRETENLMNDLNINLPADIRVLSVVEVDAKFNVIQDAKTKEYIYLFSYGQKIHPFAAPYMCYIKEELDISVIKEGAGLFQGVHNFQNFCYKPNEQTQFEREVILSEVVENNIFQANFFPEQSYLYRVKGSGFMRHQIRMMMGALFMLGKGEIDLQQLKESIEAKVRNPWNYIAPASGLILNKVGYE